MTSLSKPSAVSPVSQLVQNIDYKNFQIDNSFFNGTYDFVREDSHVPAWVVRNKDGSHKAVIQTDDLKGQAPVGITIVKRPQIFGKNQSINTGWQEKIDAISTCFKKNSTKDADAQRRFGKNIAPQGSKTDLDVIDQRRDNFCANYFSLVNRFKLSAQRHKLQIRVPDPMELEGIKGLLSDVGMLEFTGYKSPGKDVPDNEDDYKGAPGPLEPVNVNTDLLKRTKK